jgi:PIN domain nuclease of toxin-antitoxin system
MLLLDTHVLIWFAEDNPRLGARATKLADAALQRDAVLGSAVSFWEIAMLVDKRRMELALAPKAMRQKVLEQGIREVPLSGALAISAAELVEFQAIRQIASSSHRRWWKGRRC